MSITRPMLKLNLNKNECLESVVYWDDFRVLIGSYFCMFYYRKLENYVCLH